MVRMVITPESYPRHRSSSLFYWISVQEYEVANKRIVSGQAMVEGKGISPWRPTLEYSYSDSGKLEQIVCIDDSVFKTAEFAARSRISTKDLTAKLAKRMPLA